MRRALSVGGSDKEAITDLIAIHACPEPRILDATHNEGRMWKGLPYKPHRSDIDPTLLERGLIDTVADCRDLPFEDGSFDVIIFDVPHVEDAGEMGTNYVSDFGLGTDNLDVVGLFGPSMLEFSRVLVKPHGIVLAKIVDYVHSTAMQWQHLDLMAAARDAGMTRCDVKIIVQWNRGALIDPKWKHVNHLRSVHNYWFCFRNGPSCVSAFAPEVDVKPRTGELFELDTGNHG